MTEEVPITDTAATEAVEAVEAAVVVLAESTAVAVAAGADVVPMMDRAATDIVVDSTPSVDALANDPRFKFNVGVTVAAADVVLVRFCRAVVVKTATVSAVALATVPVVIAETLASVEFDERLVVPSGLTLVLV